MAYRAQPHGSAQGARRRMAAVTSVAVLHAGVFYVLVTGLAGVVKMIEPSPNLRTHDDPITMPVVQPTAQPSPKPHHDTRQIVIRDPLPDLLLPKILPTALPTPPATVGVGNLDPGLGMVDATPTPTPTPRFAPHNAAPRGRQDMWITPNDYPASDLRQGNSGITGFRLTIGRDGHPQSCTITSSSGHPRSTPRLADWSSPARSSSRPPTTPAARPRAVIKARSIG